MKKLLPSFPQVLPIRLSQSDPSRQVGLTFLKKTAFFGTLHGRVGCPPYTMDVDLGLALGNFLHHSNIRRLVLSLATTKAYSTFTAVLNHHDSSFPLIETKVRVIIINNLHLDENS